MVSDTPNFLGLGVAKAATTSIARLLAAHPQISFPVSGTKELHFFDYAENDSDDAVRDYLGSFEPNRVVGEFTPSYLFVKESRDRIFRTLGTRTKFFVVLRDPVDRAYSHYCHAVNEWGAETYRARGYPVEDLSFLEAIRAEPRRLESGEYHIRHQSYFSKGLYAAQLRWYFQKFPRDNFHIGFFDDFVADPTGFMNEIFRFLEISEHTFDADASRKMNSQTRGTIAAADRAWLVDKYLDSIADLEELLGVDLSAWKLVD